MSETDSEKEGVNTGIWVVSLSGGETILSDSYSSGGTVWGFHPPLLRLGQVMTGASVV